LLGASSPVSTPRGPALKDLRSLTCQRPFFPSSRLSFLPPFSPRFSLPLPLRGPVNVWSRAGTFPSRTSFFLRQGGFFFTLFLLAFLEGPRSFYRGSFAFAQKVEGPPPRRFFLSDAVACFCVLSVTLFSTSIPFFFFWRFAGSFFLSKDRRTRRVVAVFCPRNYIAPLGRKNPCV